MTHDNQNSEILQDSELILNEDGSVYHLHLKDMHIADTIILVGDPGRVEQVSRHFDHVQHKIQNREFHTHTGIYKGKPISAISSGIGTDNIDIVMNELDAAVNIDPDTRIRKDSKRKLEVIRVGTSGALQKDIPVGSYVLAEFGLGLDGVIHYYSYNYNSNEQQLTNSVKKHLNLYSKLPEPYITQVSAPLMSRLSAGMVKGITVTASGFYGPQGRRLNLIPRDQEMNDRLQSFEFNGHRVTNYEMETSALYGLGNMLGHECCTCCAIIANRMRKEYSEDHTQIVNDLIVTVLDRLANS